jgi:hypothetical protein
MFIELNVRFLFLTKDDMDWTYALDWNRKVLLRVIAQVFASAGLAVDGSVTHIPRHARTRAYGILVPAEVALRALIVVASLVLGRPEVTLAQRKARSKTAAKNASEKQTRAKRCPAFRLFDPRKIFGQLRRRGRKGFVPRIYFFDGRDEPPSHPKPILPDDLVNARALQRRLEAMRGALEDIPKQVRRLARAQARREQAGNPIRHPLRTGRRPGYRAKPRHYVDLISRNCQSLAHLAAKDFADPPREAPPDTS